MSTEAVAASLPIELAIRLLLDDVSFSNVLPDWFETDTIDYTARGSTIQQLADEYLNGRRPSPPLRVDVPKRNGRSNSWVVPSINDQIVCQACVSAMAEHLQRRCIDPERVFSCRLNSDPEHLSFLENQVSAWARFKARTRQLCTRDTCVLQIDIKDTFDSIGIDSVGRFLSEQDVDRSIVELLTGVLDGLSAPHGQLPFLNNSVFFIGNAYLSKVDRVVGSHTRHFVRWMDDYKIFGPSRAELEQSFKGIVADLRKLGLEVNDSKVSLGSSEDYLDALSAIRYGQTETTQYMTETYLSPGVFDPKPILAMIRSVLADPAAYLHQGYGRMLMGTLRRTRVAGMFSDTKKYGPSPAAQLADALAKDTATLSRLCDLLDSYSRDDTNTWRLIWLLYLGKDVRPEAIADGQLRQRYQGMLARIQATQTLSLISRLWATDMPAYPSINQTRPQIEQLQGMGYVERGRRCYGSGLHA